jgi:hypothetical protein
MAVTDEPSYVMRAIFSHVAHDLRVDSKKKKKERNNITEPSYAFEGNLSASNSIVVSHFLSLTKCINML